MSRDIYSSLSGAKAAWRSLETVSQNISNISTTAFKERRVRYESVAAGVGPLADSYVRDDNTSVDLRDGPVRADGVDTHIALHGDGFMVAERPGGDKVLVRAGALQLDRERRLVTPQGWPIQGQGGAIEVPENRRLVIDTYGRVLTDDGTELDRLQILSAEGVTPMGSGAFVPIGETWPSETTTVTQGALEGSNADAIRGMTDLIQAGRYFEIYQRAMKTSDELDARANDMARKK